VARKNEALAVGWLAKVFVQCHLPTVDDGRGIMVDEGGRESQS
jgi:hypothetical protein